jgi:queuosine precursor transporter
MSDIVVPIMKQNKVFNFFRAYACTLSYIVFIVVINALFVYMPFIKINGAVFSSADFIVGVIYVMRDFAQREIKHYVIVAMFVGAILSYLLADKQVAVASVASFLIAESIDWGIYTFTRKPLSKRILWSASISVPIDSAVFLYMMNQLNGTGLWVMASIKILGVLGVWYFWRVQDRAAIRFAQERNFL